MHAIYRYDDCIHGLNQGKKEYTDEGIRFEATRKIARLTNETFKFDERIGEGWFSAVYFLKTTKSLKSI